jgi:hypothetical protein
MISSIDFCYIEGWRPVLLRILSYICTLFLHPKGAGYGVGRGNLEILNLLKTKAN